MKKYSIEDIQNAMTNVMEKYSALKGRTEAEVENDKRIISVGYNILIDALEGHLPKV